MALLKFHSVVELVLLYTVDFFFLLPKASKLAKQIVVLEDKKKSQEEEITKYQKQLEVLCSAGKELKAKLDSRITAEEHLAVVNDLKRYDLHMVHIWRNIGAKHAHDQSCTRSTL